MTESAVRGELAQLREQLVAELVQAAERDSELAAILSTVAGVLAGDARAIDELRQDLARLERVVVELGNLHP